MELIFLLYKWYHGYNLVFRFTRRDNGDPLGQEEYNYDEILAFTSQPNEALVGGAIICVLGIIAIVVLTNGTAAFWAAKILENVVATAILI